MKLFVAVFLLLTILGSQATKQSYQPVLKPTLTKKDQLKNSHFGNAILNMIELGNAVQADFDDLFESLALLKENLVESKEREISEYTADEATHQSEVTRISVLIAGYEADIITYEDELTGLGIEAERLATVLSNQQTQLTNATNQKTSEEELLVTLTENYEQQVQDFSSAITLLNQAIETLQTGQSQSESAFGAFIQTNQSSFISLGKQIEFTSKKIMNSSPLTKGVSLFFAELASNQAQPTNESISRAINALQELIIYYQNGQSALTTNYQAEYAQHEALIDGLVIQIGDLTNTVIPKTEQDIFVNSEATESRTNLLTLTRANLATETDNLEAENESWEERTSQHEELLPQYDEEYALVEQCETVLRQSSI